MQQLSLSGLVLRPFNPLTFLFVEIESKEPSSSLNSVVNMMGLSSMATISLFYLSSLMYLITELGLTVFITLRR